MLKHNYFCLVRGIRSVKHLVRASLLNLVVWLVLSGAEGYVRVASASNFSSALRHLGSEAEATSPASSRSRLRSLARPKSPPSLGSHIQELLLKMDVCLLA